ncbi:hypothetical protein ASPACDRAFT_61378 [Aspergillus aculeatus ATCC 16872]|uniref:Hydrophobin n=1 Tax=Aspergillus aculeatus (strain ATCC 16872 / CBS 172.66 / WB 5094) TaxID=690307 RepID=A0A1L9WR49_ASPA1|nr:uncharacterized protein ASPACDRAFT_61378 [Aspergillus aculeatus ATCC 16872]OJJ98646.1 hypothetical protein ASPACDRAFT_61378 [Aspergillus aculeatus ATCC 16872]
MHCNKALLYTNLLILFAAVVVQALDTCTKDGNAVQCCAAAGFPIPGALTRKRASHRGLFTRDAACPSSVQCCEKQVTSTVTKLTPGSFGVQCGTKYDPGTDSLDQSTANLEIVKCNTFPLFSADPQYKDQDCLKVTGGPILDSNGVPIPLTSPFYHLAVSGTPISTDPGHYGVTHDNPTWCTQPTPSTMQCFVPFSYIESQITPPPTDLCHSSVYVGLLLDIAGNTCTIQPGPLTGTGNFFQSVLVTFSCEDTTTCQTQCCCPVPVVSKKPCAAGSAYAQSANALNAPPIGCGHWGWYFPKVTSGFTAPLILGQTTNIGSVIVTISGNTVSWVYNVNSDYGLTEAHADVICGGIDLKHTTPPKDGDACVPGKFTKNSGCLAPVAGGGWSASYTCNNGGQFSLVFHAKVVKFVDPTSTQCNAVVCPDASD